MSTFGGLMVEYPQIAIDRFQGDAVLRARAYFLSHCHSDHMVGLSSKTFADRLKWNPNIRLYCSEVTYEFLLTDDRYKHLRSSLSSLPVEQTVTVTLKNEFNGQEEKLLVTLLPASHCPGSVMFLFEGSEGTVLYTGDFRLAKGEAARMVPLHSGSRVKDIVSVYLDTTFCVPEAMYIPSREESKDALLNLVDMQIRKSSGHMVKLNCKAKYGYEYLFVEMSKTFNQKIHVSDTVMKQYDRVPDLRNHLTTEGSQTQIHACRYGACSLKNATDILSIQPSTMWFTSNARPDDVVRKIGRRYRLCFSFHSSFSEIRDFLGYIRPKNVYPNVIPYGSSEEEVVKRLKDCLRNSKTKLGEGCGISMATEFKPFGSLKNIHKVKRKRQCDHRQDDFHDLFDSSPEKQMKKTKPPRDANNSRTRKESTSSSDDDWTEEETTGPPASDVLPWKREDGMEDGSNRCTFADSDGAMSDSEEAASGEEEENDGKHNTSSSKMRRTNQSEGMIGDLKCRTSDPSLECARTDDRLYGSDGESVIKRTKYQRKDSETDEEENEDSVINPSQSSVNEGSMALFSDDSHPGNSQRSSGLSSNDWLQYLPLKRTPPKTPPNQETKDDLIQRGDDDVENTSGCSPRGSSTSPILISDDDIDEEVNNKVNIKVNVKVNDKVMVEDDSDSDATYICSQRSVRSEGSSLTDIEIISISPAKHSTRGLSMDHVANSKRLSTHRTRDEPSYSNTDTAYHSNQVVKREVANSKNQRSKLDDVEEGACSSSLESVFEISISP